MLPLGICFEHEPIPLPAAIRGLYDDERDAANMVVDFVVFCKLALRRGLLPKNWNWKVLLMNEASVSSTSSLFCVSCLLVNLL